MMYLFRFQSSSKKGSQHPTFPSFEVLQPLRRWLNEIKICNPAQANLICRLIPAQCPFEQEIRIGKRIHFYIPPLCKLNPLYEEMVTLRFRALTYLAEECAVDVCHYC